ncbi:right-handed parallel beta-helix repeat-containing protein [Microbulbifer sp. SSSA008]|uniref:right-handed parallel beta-helix repeat-containing protein n=1 Tax=Microbulbifer sp. SSSA008 TaxID=3243380 RepID=UPI0040392479
MKIKQSVDKVALLAIIAFSASSYSSITLAEVACGDVITTAEVLTEDLSCDLTTDEPDALTIVGPSGSLNMGDYSLTCTTGGDLGGAGIRIEGNGATLTGGVIDGCFDGVFLEGEGYHKVLGTEVVNSVNDGIDIDSIYNTINDCVITDSGRVGVDMDDDYNTFSGCTVTGSVADGIQVDDSFSRVFNNTSSGNGGAGILIEGSSNNVISQNTTTDNGNGDSQDGGIVLIFTNSNFNIISANSSFNNDPFDLRDTVDPDCSGTNIWVNNEYLTKDPDCLD